MNIHEYWDATVKQSAGEMKKYFHTDACIRWHNTNEQFTAEEFIQVNCEYPDKWDGKIEQVTEMENEIITVVKVFATNKPLSFHVVSFIRLKEDKIISIDEYWGDDGIAPEWRLDKQMGTPILKEE